MSVVLDTDTIVAVATPPGVAAIAVVRISGPEAVHIADRVFRGRTSLAEAEPWRVYLGKVVDPDTDPGEIVDEVLVTVFRHPRSYTGEDLVEISCHGGRYVSARIVGLLICAGARLAEPGEFTRRAFLNGRLDLSQAEAVADLIEAKSASASRLAGAQLAGALSRKVQRLREELIELCSQVELQLDFAEEDVAFADAETVARMLVGVEEQIRQLAATYQRGRILRHGARTVIVGKPNVGKSSLLNALLRQDRAIVTPIPGTTRDSLEEEVTFNGFLFRLVDTAGLRGSKDLVEKEGVRRTEEWLRSADLILWVVDAHGGFDQGDQAILRRLRQLRAAERPEAAVVVAANKIDLLAADFDATPLSKKTNGWPVVPISATEMIGLENLQATLVRTVDQHGGHLDEEEVVVAEERHRVALETAMVAMRQARESAERGLSGEFVAVDLRAAADHLGRIIGVVGVEEILDNIFARFCIGK